MDSMLVRRIYTASRAKVKCVESGQEVGEDNEAEAEEEEADADAMLWWTQKQVHDPLKLIWHYANPKRSNGIKVVASLEEQWCGK